MPLLDNLIIREVYYELNHMHDLGFCTRVSYGHEPAWQYDLNISADRKSFKARWTYNDQVSEIPGAIFTQFFSNLLKSFLGWIVRTISKMAFQLIKYAHIDLIMFRERQGAKPFPEEMMTKISYGDTRGQWVKGLIQPSNPYGR